MLQRNRAFPNVVHVQSQREDVVVKLRRHEKNESDSVGRWTGEVVPSMFGASQSRRCVITTGLIQVHVHGCASAYVFTCVFV